jgi:S1-C subfamily serine protease
MLNDVGGSLIATGRAPHPWLGVQVMSLRDELDDDPAGSERYGGLECGVCIKTIEANAPAYKSDLRPKDVVTKVDGVAVLTAHDLQREILRKKVGQSVALSVWREGKTFDISIVTDEMPADLTQIAEAHARAKFRPGDNGSYGLQFPPVHPNAQAQPVRDKINAGASVIAVLPDSPAGRAGVRVGDIITAVDQKPVIDSASCLELLAAHRGASGPMLSIDRNGQKARALLDTGGSEKP